MMPFVKINKYSKYILIGLGIVIVFFLFGFGDSSYRFAKNYFKDKIQESEFIQDLLKEKDLEYAERFKKSKDSLLEIRENEKEIEDSINKYKFKYGQIQNQRDAINDINASYSELDSLARHVIYK